MTALRELEAALWLTELSLDEFDVRGALLLGSRGAVAWDTLSHPRDMAPVALRVAGRPLTVVYSHADWDHAWGTAGLRGVEAIIGHDACLARFSSDVPATLDRKLSERPDLWSGVTLVPPTRTFDSEFRIDLGDLSLVLHHLPGHTRDCLVGFIPERGVLLMGDTVETPFPVVNDGAALAGWMAGLERWADDPAVRVVVPAHGVIGGREIIRRTVDYLSSLLAGHSPGIPAEMSPFYRETHAGNLAAAKRAQKRGTPS